MKVVLQRVESARVTVDDETVGEIGRGLLALVGIARDDDERDVDILARRTAHLRLFDDGERRGAWSVADIAGAVLVVSQFTLLASTKRGNRPSWSAAAPPETAAPLVERFALRVREEGVDVATGRFGAHMRISLVNDGPVTLVLEHPV